MENTPKQENAVTDEKAIQYENAEPISSGREAAQLLSKADTQVDLLADNSVHISVGSFDGWPERYLGTKYYRLDRGVFDAFQTAGYLSPIVAPGVSNAWRLRLAKAREDEDLFPRHPAR